MALNLFSYYTAWGQHGGGAVASNLISATRRSLVRFWWCMSIDMHMRLIGNSLGVDGCLCRPCDKLVTCPGCTTPSSQGSWDRLRHSCKPECRISGHRQWMDVWMDWWTIQQFAQHSFKKVLSCNYRFPPWLLAILWQNSPVSSIITKTSQALAGWGLFIPINIFVSGSPILY